MIAAILVSLVGLIKLPLSVAVRVGETTGVWPTRQVGWLHGIARPCHVRWTHSIGGVIPTMGWPEQNQKWIELIFIEETSRRIYHPYPLVTGHHPLSTPIVEYVTD